jgi:8-oxo-dGTP pyrophosphatase MutT (NUDIX family)
MTCEEVVTIVDEKNNIVGAEPRSRMRTYGLPHRATYILVFNSEGDLFLQKRTSHKDIYPGFYDVATGGVVKSGETYEKSALRELSEELGVDKVELHYLFDFYHEDVGNRVWGRAFWCIYDGDVTLQEEEVEWGRFYPIEKILMLADRRRFTPDGLYVLQRYLNAKEPDRDS